MILYDKVNSALSVLPSSFSVKQHILVDTLVKHCILCILDSRQAANHHILCLSMFEQTLSQKLIS